jgi:hypothetical protein
MLCTHPNSDGATALHLTYFYFHKYLFLLLYYLQNYNNHNTTYDIMVCLPRCSYVKNMVTMAPPPPGQLANTKLKHDENRCGVAKKYWQIAGVSEH